MEEKQRSGEQLSELWEGCVRKRRSLSDKRFFTGTQDFTRLILRLCPRMFYTRSTSVVAELVGGWAGGTKGVAERKTIKIEPHVAWLPFWWQDFSAVIWGAGVTLAGTGLAGSFMLIICRHRNCQFLLMYRYCSVSVYDHSVCTRLQTGATSPSSLWTLGTSGYAVRLSPCCHGK